MAFMKDNLKPFEMPPTFGYPKQRIGNYDIQLYGSDDSLGIVGPSPEKKFDRCVRKCRKWLEKRTKQHGSHVERLKHRAETLERRAAQLRKKAGL